MENPAYQKDDSVIGGQTGKDDGSSLFGTNIWTRERPSPSGSSQSTGPDLQDGNSTSDLVSLKRNVGLFGSISLIVGTMIGSGIFVSPGGVLTNSVSVWFSLIIWVACGILSTFGGIVYIELSTVIPSSGAEYSYIYGTFGGIPGFLTAWSQLTLIKPSLTAAICLAFAQYVVDPFVDDISTVPWALKLVTILLIIFLTYLNCISTKLANNIQVVCTVAKLLAIVIIVITGVVKMSQGHTENLKPDFDLIDWDFGKIASAFYSGLWAYDGWNQLNTVTEEIDNPYKNLPRGIIFGIPLVTICYLLVNIAFLTVLTPGQVIDSSSVATLFGDNVFGVMSFLMPLSVAFSTFGAANGSLFTSARMTYVAGREGHLPDSLAYVNVRHKTPTPSLILNAVIAIALTVVFNITELIDFFSFTAWIFYGATAACMIVLRYTRPDAHRPFKAPIWMAVIVVVMSIFLVVAPVALDPQIGYLYSTVFILCGLILYVPFVHRKLVLPGMGAFTRLIQNLFLVVPPEAVDENVIISAK